ncbi:hypothetical protein ACVGVM_24565 [Pseudonocardia bannensis]|uniref:Uncharacterized protein n=1 Tax=Pseudonocardia bannensis TaxID=630973 RepID=A0A848DMH2_9PSEU|nr:hypothetical protein [Pseudonocardia bannensis]NMH93696.1 hypothetical protein [Pseudonocardia bannensis]
MTGDRPLVAGMTLYLVITAAPTLLFWAALRVPAAVAACRARRPGVPTGPSLESLVADLRRLRREVCGPPPRTRLRRVALLMAYDDVLIGLAGAVGVDAAPLAAAREGTSDRAYVRLQTEAAVEAAGIALDPPAAAGPEAA